MNMAEGKRRFFDFVEALEEERCKIQMFSRELPLCLQLVNEAIDSLRRQIPSEEPFSDKPALEDFMRIKPNSFSSRSSRDLNHEKGASDCKLDWLRSVHIRGLAVTEAPAAETGTLRKPLAVNATRVSGAFQPFERNKAVPAVPAIPVPFAAPAVSSTTTITMGGRQDGGGEVEEEDRQSLGPPTHPNRKQRRCWSPDLHRKFLSALEELGGSHAATPKQIREMMKVDNLTNDEVKSHLQKYRLHTRRPATTVQSTGSNGTRSPPHFVLLGSIWVPPHDYVMKTAQPAEVSSAALNETFSPEASLPLELGLQEEQSAKKQLTNQPSVMPKHSLQVFSQDDDSLLDDSATNSNSSAASFFSQTTTASPLS